MTHNTIGGGPRPMVSLRTVICPLLLVGLLVIADIAAAQSLTDYLTPALRARVERLKADSAATPTDVTNLSERGRVLWNWANAYALSGGQLPVQFTRAMAAALSPYTAAPDSPAVIDGFITEMALLDEQPDALPSNSASGGPFVAGTWATVTQSLTVGSKPLQAGGGILVARNRRSGSTALQARDPADDNYISIHTDAPGVRFATDSAPVPGTVPAPGDASNALVFRVATGTLRRGDRITLTYGDQSHGSRGMRMPKQATAALPLPIYVAWDSRSHFHAVPPDPITISGAQAVAVQAHVPSLAGPDEPIALTISAQDAYGNRAADGHPEWRVLLDGSPFREIPASDTPVTVLRNIRLGDPGVHRFSIEDPDGRIRGAANPLLITAAPRERILWGDPHGNSGFGQGFDTLKRYVQWASDEAALDYIALSEFDLWLDDAEWDAMRSTALRCDQCEQLVVFLGYQWSAHTLNGGYHTVLFRSAANRNRVPVQLFPTLSRFYAGLRAAADPADILVIGRAQAAADHRQSDPQLEHLIAIHSGRGSFEWLLRQYLQNGHQVGTAAGSRNAADQISDTSRATWLPGRGGLTAAMVEPDDELFDALRARRTYATTGERIILEFNVNGHSMGERGAFASNRFITGRVVGTAPIESVAVIRNGVEVWRRNPLAVESSTLDPARVLLTFTSGSEPYHPGDNPRGWRPWHGSVEVSGSTLTSTRTFGGNHLQSPQVIEEDDRRRLHFATATRGHTSSVEITLDELRRDTEFTVRIQPARETGTPEPLYRPHELLNGQELTLFASDLENGAKTIAVPAEFYSDHVRMQRMPADGASDVSFAFEDESDRQGDYYYLRAVQLNGATAWSSPIWIGGHQTR